MYRKCLSVLFVFVLINSLASSVAKPQPDTFGSHGVPWYTVGSIVDILPGDLKLISRVLGLIAKRWDVLGSMLGIGSQNRPASSICADWGCSEPAPSDPKAQQNILELLDREWDIVSSILDIFLSDEEIQSRIEEITNENWDEIEHILFHGDTDSDSAEGPVAYVVPVGYAVPLAYADPAADADPASDADSSA